MSKQFSVFNAGRVVCGEQRFLKDVPAQEYIHFANYSRKLEISAEI